MTTSAMSTFDTIQTRRCPRRMSAYAGHSCLIPWWVTGLPSESARAAFKRPHDRPRSYRECDARIKNCDLNIMAQIGHNFGWDEYNRCVYEHLTEIAAKKRSPSTFDKVTMKSKNRTSSFILSPKQSHARLEHEAIDQAPFSSVRCRSFQWQMVGLEYAKADHFYHWPLHPSDR